MASLILFSCQKEEFETNTSHDQADIRYIELLGSGRSGTNGMLHFPTMDMFLATIDQLEASEQLHDDSFMAQWGHLSEDALYNKEIELGHDEHKPYADFEKQYSGFKSLRKKVRDAENIWLKNDILDDANDPDNHFVWETGLRTVLNEKAQVKIGDSLYQMTRFGYVKITDGDANKLAMVENGDASQLSVPNIEVVGAYYGSKEGNAPENSGSCIGAEDEDKFWYPVSDRRIKGKQRLKPPAYPWGSVVKSKTVHYKKVWYGWTRSKATITAEIRDESVNEYCINPVMINKARTKYAREVDVRDDVPWSSGYHIKSKQRKLKSVHKRNSATYTNFYFD